MKIYDLILRIRDILIALVALIILSPAFLIIAVLIKRDSEGPVFYSGLRSGKGGGTFNILKFRTMYEKPENHDGPKITGENDPRITPFGGWLRDTKLNELPQLWNVLKGEMSLVGPRPEDPDIVATWLADTRDEILSIRPGITSPASVLYRDEEAMLSNEKLMETYFGMIQPSKLRLDQLYVRHRSMWVDIDVILWTFLILLPGLTKFKPPERLLYGGIMTRGANYLSSWFVIDFFVALFAISASGILLRTLGPIHIGALQGVAVAFYFAIVFTIVGALVGIQRIHWSKASPADVFELLLTSLLAAVVLLGVNLINNRLPNYLIISGAVTTFFGLVLTRYRYRLITGSASRWLKFRKGGAIYQERILIIGSGDAGSYAAWMLTNSKEALKFHVVGYLDDDIHKHGIRFRGIKVLGDTQELKTIVSDYDVGIILYAIHNIPKEKQDEILQKCGETSAQVVMFPDVIAQLSNAMEKNGKSDGEHEILGKNGSVIKPRKSKELDELSSNSPAHEMIAVLELLKSNLEQGDYEQGLENVSTLQELIREQEEANIDERSRV